MQRKVYVQTDDHSHITGCEGGYAAPADLSHWICIDQGTGDRYNLCQIHYFSGGLTNSDGTHRYIYDPSLTPAWREATEEELAAELAEIEARKAPIEPTSEDILGVQVAQLALKDMQKEQTINALGAQLAQISLEIINLRGSAL